jgi:hypothetical protein
MAKVSHPTEDFQRSCACNTWCKKGITYFSLILFITFGNISFKSYHWKGNWTCPHLCKSRCFNHGFLIEHKNWYHFAIYNTNPFKKLLSRIKFVIRACLPKFFVIWNGCIIFLFFATCFFTRNFCHLLH